MKTTEFRWFFLSIDFKSLAGELLFFAENILLIYYSSDK